MFENTETGRKIVDLVGSDFKISEITCYEITRKYPQREQLVSIYDALPFDRESRKCSAELYLSARKAGRVAGELDVLIAGTALANSLVIVSQDRDFEKLNVECRIFPQKG